MEPTKHYIYRLNDDVYEMLQKESDRIHLKRPILVRQIILEDIEDYEIGQPLPDEEKGKTKNYFLKLPTSEYKKLEHNAAVYGLAVSSYIRFLIMQRLIAENPLTKK